MQDYQLHAKKIIILPRIFVFLFLLFYTLITSLTIAAAVVAME